MVEQHLETCPRCGREYAELAGLPALLDLAGSADARARGAAGGARGGRARPLRARAPRARRPRRAGLAASSASARRWRPRLAAAVARARRGRRLLVRAGGGLRPRGHDAAAPVARGPTSARCAPAREWTSGSAASRVRAPARTSSGASRRRAGGSAAAASAWTGAAGRDVELTSAARPGDYERMLVTRGSKAARRGAQGPRRVLRRSNRPAGLSRNPGVIKPTRLPIAGAPGRRAGIRRLWRATTTTTAAAPVPPSSPRRRPRAAAAPRP